MNDPLLVGVPQRVQELDTDCRRHLWRQRRSVFENGPERSSFDQLHDEKPLCFVFVRDVVDLDDVWMAELGNCASFRRKAVTYLDGVSQVGVEHFERNIPPEALVVRSKHSRHTAVTEFFDHRVFCNFRKACACEAHGRAKNVHHEPRGARTNLPRSAFAVVADAVAPQVATNVGALHGRAPTDFTNVSVAFREES